MVVVLALVGWIYARSQSNQPEYDAYDVKVQDLEESLELSGEVSASSIATLRFGAGGYVTYLGAKEGDSVKKWQTLASLDSRGLQKILEQKLNLYAIQRATFDQTVDDNDNSVPDGDLGRELSRLLAKNQYQLENTVKDVEYQDLALQLSRISSPLTGILVHAPTSVANVQVSATDTWVVVDPSTLEFVADLDETELARVEVGMPVKVVLDAYPEDELASTVSSISYTPKETTTGTTYEIKVQLPDTNLSKLRLGLNGTARVIIGKKPTALTVPTSAISFESQGSVVYKLTDGKYQPHPVTTGIESDGYIEIESGVSEGEVVYVKKAE